MKMGNVDMILTFLNDRVQAVGSIKDSPLNSSSISRWQINTNNPQFQE